MTTVAVQFEGLTLHPVPDPVHDWTMSTAEVAAAFGVEPALIRQAKARLLDSNEIVEGKHYAGVEKDYASRTVWSKRGVIRLGFAIRSARAKLFRDFAEELVLGAVSAGEIADLRATVAELSRRLGLLESGMRYVPKRALPARPPRAVCTSTFTLDEARRQVLDAARAPGGVASVHGLAVTLGVSWWLAKRAADTLAAEGLVTLSPSPRRGYRITAVAA